MANTTEPTAVTAVYQQPPVSHPGVLLLPCGPATTCSPPKGPAKPRLLPRVPAKLIVSCFQADAISCLRPLLPGPGCLQCPAPHYQADTATGASHILSSQANSRALLGCHSGTSSYLDSQGNPSTSLSSQARASLLLSCQYDPCYLLGSQVPGRPLHELFLVYMVPSMHCRTCVSYSCTRYI